MSQVGQGQEVEEGLEEAPRLAISKGKDEMTIMNTMRTSPRRGKSKMVSMRDILTEAEIKTAENLYTSVPVAEFNKKVAEEIISPVLRRINAKLGQENDARYIGYLVEYEFMKRGVQR